MHRASTDPVLHISAAVYIGQTGPSELPLGRAKRSATSGLRHCMPTVIHYPVLRVRTAVAQSRSSACIHPSLWNRRPLSSPLYRTFWYFFMIFLSLLVLTILSRFLHYTT